MVFWQFQSHLLIILILLKLPVAQAQLHMANIMVDVDHEMSIIDDIEGNEEVFADQGTGDSNQDQLTEIFSLDEK